MNGTSYLVMKQLLDKKKKESSSVVDENKQTETQRPQQEYETPKIKQKPQVDETNHISGILIDDSQSAIEDPTKIGKIV